MNGFLIHLSWAHGSHLRSLWLSTQLAFLTDLRKPKTKADCHFPLCMVYSPRWGEASPLRTSPLAVKKANNVNSEAVPPWFHPFISAAALKQVWFGDSTEVHVWQTYLSLQRGIQLCIYWWPQQHRVAYSRYAVSLGKAERLYHPCGLCNIMGLIDGKTDQPNGGGIISNECAIIYH